MPNAKTSVKAGSSVVFLVAAICCAVFSFQALCKENDKKAGILTLKFDFDNIHLPSNLPSIKRANPERGILQPLQSEVPSAGNVAATVIPSITSLAKSAASAAATIIAGGIDRTTDKLIPRNCSLGTKQYCVGFEDRTECNSLPLNISNILPEALAKADGGLVRRLRSLEGSLTKVSPAYIQNCFIVGLALALIMAIIFGISLSRRYYWIDLHGLGLPWTIILSLVVGVLCCVSFLIPTVILYILCSKAEELQSSIKTKPGEVREYCLGALISALVMTVLFTRALIQKCMSEQESRNPKL